MDSPTSFDEDSDIGIDTSYLYIEAKERNAYRARGYQRAFNFARMLTDFLGWVAYGQYQDPTLIPLFYGAFNRNFSRSHNLEEIMSSYTVNGTNLLANLAYENNSPNAEVVQFGSSERFFIVFAQEEFATDIGNRGGLLGALVDGVRIVPQLPSR